MWRGLPLGPARPKIGVQCVEDRFVSVRPTLEPSGAIPTIDEQSALTEWLASERNNGQVVKTKLRTSDRVIARVTDGIYQEPRSAQREHLHHLPGRLEPGDLRLRQRQPPRICHRLELELHHLFVTAPGSSR